MLNGFKIGYTGFEPATSSSRTTRATSCANTRKESDEYALPGRTAGCPYLLPVNKKESLPKTEGLARAAGLEPAISGVTGQRDNQLRYARVMFFILHESGLCVNNLNHKK